MSSKTACPTRQAFEEAIIILVIRLSHYYDGCWFSVSDMRALLVAGGIIDELTEKHVMFAIRCRNNTRLVDNRYGSKSTRYYQPVDIQSPTLPCDDSDGLPTIPDNYFLAAEFEEQVSSFHAYIGQVGAASTSLPVPMPTSQQILVPEPLPLQTSQEPNLLLPLLPRSPSCLGTSASCAASSVLPLFVTPPPQSVSSNSPGNQKCRGWTGVKYDSLFKVSYCNFVGHSMTTAGPVFAKDHPSVDLSLAFLRITKSAKKLHFVLERGKWVLCSKGCSGNIDDGSSKKTLCNACKLMKCPVSKVALAKAKFAKEIHSRMKIDQGKLQLLGPVGQFKLLQEVCKEKTRMQKAAKKVEKRLYEALEQNLSEARHENLGMLQNILPSALPLFEQVCSKEEMVVVCHSMAILDGQ
jgi:hypothetical protein